jgi:hypothetical protein
MDKQEKILKIMEQAKTSVQDLDINQRSIYLNLLVNEEKELNRVAEMTASANIDRVATVFLPAIKKLARDSFIEKLVGVQPIPDRVGLVQYVDYVHSATDTDSGVQVGTSVYDSVSTEYSRDPGEAQKISRGIDFVFREKEIKARQRKLAGRWTFEAQDSARIVGYNIEEEITKTLSSKIVEEINYEILNDLYASANGASATWTQSALSDAPSVKDRNEKELYYAIVDVATAIYDRTRRYPNYVVCNSKIASILKRTGDYVYPTPQGGGLGDVIRRLFVAGTLNDEFMLYVVPKMNTNDILVGYKGNSELETGYIYAPYIPLIVMDPFFNPEDWTWIRSVGSFYAKALVMPELYGKVIVQLT